jgi:hypothetical protein
MDIVGFVRVLRHATYRQLRALLFHTNKSDTPLDRRLEFLTATNYLHRSKQTVDDGGAARYVYRLALEGHRLFSDKPFKPYRQKVPHCLRTGDRVVDLYELHRAGIIRLNHLEFEPDNHLEIAGAWLTPDLTAELTLPAYGDLPIWHEIDLGTEGPTRLRMKMAAYTKALRNYSAADQEILPRFPYVLWVCPDQDRVAKIQKIVNERPVERERNIFRVTTFDGYKQYFVPDPAPSA